MCSARLDKANREAAFSEAVSRLMRVPSRLKVAVDDLPLDPTQDFPPFFWMQVPERLLPAEVKAVTFQPSLAQRHCPFADGLFLEPATHKVGVQHTFLSFASQPGPQKNKPLGTAGGCALANAETCWLGAISHAVPGSHVEQKAVGPTGRPGLLTELPITLLEGLLEGGLPIHRASRVTTEAAGQPRFTSLPLVYNRHFWIQPGHRGCQSRPLRWQWRGSGRGRAGWSQAPCLRAPGSQFSLGRAGSTPGGMSFKHCTSWGSNCSSCFGSPDMSKSVV